LWEKEDKHMRYLPIKSCQECPMRTKDFNTSCRIMNRVFNYIDDERDFPKWCPLLTLTNLVKKNMNISWRKKKVSKK